MAQPVKAATPLTAAIVLLAWLQVSVAPVGFVWKAIDTAVDHVVTVLPPRSWAVTTGCVGKTVLAPIAPVVWVVKASFAAGPTTMLKALLVALVRPADEATRV